MVTRNVDGRTQVLTVVGNHGEALPIFSGEGEAEMFVWIGGACREGWRPTETRCAEILSVLRGPCAGARTVALDPAPRSIAQETPELVGRERFEAFLINGDRHPSPKGEGSA